MSNGKKLYAERIQERRENAKVFNNKFLTKVTSLLEDHLESSGDVYLERGAFDLAQPEVLQNETEFVIEVRVVFQRPEKIAKLLQKHFDMETAVRYTPIFSVDSVPSGNVYAKGWAYSLRLNDVYLDE